MGDGEALKTFHILKGAEDRPLQLSTQVNFATSAIAEAQPYHVVTLVSGFQDM